MSKVSQGNWFKFVSPVLIMAILLSAIAVFPSPLLAATNPVLVDAGTGGPYLLGEWLEFNGNVTDDGSVTTVNLKVAGTQAFTSAALPLTDGTTTYDSDGDGAIDLIVTVDTTTTPGTILYNILWQPPYMLATYDAELPEADFAWDVPAETGVASNTKPQGLTSDGTNLFLLVDGDITDIIILTDTDGNVTTSFNAPNSKTRSIVYHNDYLYVYADDYTQTTAVTGETPMYDEWAWDYKYRLAIDNDWDKQMVEGTLVVTADGVPVTPTAIDLNGRFDLPEFTPWDAQKVQGPTVAKVGSTYHMWYYSDGEGSNQIGHATSSNGTSWTKDASNPVLSGTAAEWDASGVSNPSVVYDDDTSTYHMWYTGYDGANSGQIGYTNSTDGSTWTKYAGNPVFGPGTGGSWDDREILEVDVLAGATGYEMWYTATDSGTWTRKLGYATSTDGIAWTKYAGNPVLQPGQWWDQNGLYSPTVAKSGGSYYMWYVGGDDWGDKRIGFASGTDATTWTKLPDWWDPENPDAIQNPLIERSWDWSDWDGKDIGSPDVMAEGGGFTMWYEGVKQEWDNQAQQDVDYTSIGRSTSPISGTTWVQHENNPVLEEGSGSAVILASYSYQQGWPENSIVKISPVDGSYVEHWQSPNWGNKVGGLTTDGTTTLYGCSTEWDDLWEIDPDDGSVSYTQKPWSWDPSINTEYWFQGGDALAYRDGYLYSADSEVIHMIDTDSGEIMEVFAPIVDAATGQDLDTILGLTFIGDTATSNTVYIASFDGTKGNIYTSNLVGTVDKGASGSYTAVLDVDDTQSAGVDFDLIELGEPVQVTITAPSEGQAFFAGSSNITIAGTVNDPSVPYVTVGIETTMGALISDGAESGDSATGTGSFQKQAVEGEGWGAYSSDNLWRITDERAYSGTHSWGYNRTDGDWVNFSTPGMANAGAIVSEPFYVGSESVLSFNTSWNTDPWTEVDRKFIDIYVDGEWQPLAYIAEGAWFPDWFAGTRQMIMVPQSWSDGGMPGPGMPGMGGWNWTLVTIDLSDYAGKSDVQIRFLFDSMDSWMNDGEGWYIDDITVTGSDLNAAIAVVDGFEWETTFTLLEGFNEIIATGTSGYIGGAEGTGTDSVTVSMDTTAPVVELSTEADFTNMATVEVSGTVYELNFDNLVLTTQTEGAASPEVLLTLSDIPDAQEPPQWTFTQTVPLAEGENEIVVTVTDLAELESSATLTVIRDATGPTVSVLPTVYTIGEVSARVGDLFILQINASDDSAAGVDTVELQLPGGSEWEEFMLASELPDAIIQQWGATGTYVFPMEVPSEAPPGDYSFDVKVTDMAGNQTGSSVSALIVATLSAYNIYLMPEWNLISLPLIPDDDDITTLLGDVDGVEKVWYYDAASETWQVYNTDPAIPSDLATMETGKGYWIHMAEEAFSYSDPIAPGLPQTPTPIKFSYEGQVLEPATVPPTYALVEGWNLVGLHSERSKSINTYLRPVQGSWATLLQYDNYIGFEKGAGPDDGDQGAQDEEPNIEIFLGSYRTVLEDGDMRPGSGYWLYLMYPGNLVAQP